MSLFYEMTHKQFQELSNTQHQSKQIESEKEKENNTKSNMIKSSPNNNKDERDWIDQLTLNNLEKWFDHKPGTKIGLNDYKFDNNESISEQQSFHNKRITEIANLSVRCRDSEGERHGVDHDCIACKPWLILKRLDINDAEYDNNNNNMDNNNMEEELLNFYSHHSFKNKKSWLCSLCQKTIPIDIKTCICIGSPNDNNHNNHNNNKYHHYKMRNNKDCLIVIKELAETLHASIQFNQIPQEYKRSSKPFEYEICFDGEIISKGVGNSKRKAQRNGAEIALNELTLRGHGRKINLLQRFGRIGHQEIDRNLFVEICRDISDQKHIYSVREIIINKTSTDIVNPRLMRQILIDDAPEIKAYKTREFEISQLDEPSVLGCLDVCGPLKFSLVSGIFHKDVNNGRYGYNSYKNNIQNDKTKNNEEKRSKKKRKKRRNSKRKRIIKSEKETMSKEMMDTAINTTNECDIDDTENNVNEEEKQESTDCSVHHSFIFDPSSHWNSNSYSNSYSHSHSHSHSHSNPNPYYNENINNNNNTNSIIFENNRRHSYGSSIPSLHDSGNRRNKNMYSHPSKYEHHEIYCIDGSPQSHKQSKRRRRRRANILNNNKCEIKDNEIMIEEELLRDDDVYVCCECGKYYADNTNGRYLSDIICKWYCFNCIKRMNDSHLKPFIEMSVYTQRKNINNSQHKDNQITPPMTPPSSDDENNINNINKKKKKKNHNIHKMHQNRYHQRNSYRSYQVPPRFSPQKKRIITTQKQSKFEEENIKIIDIKKKSPDIVIQEICNVDTETSDIMLFGPHTPSSPSLSDKGGGGRNKNGDNNNSEHEHNETEQTEQTEQVEQVEDDEDTENSTENVTVQTVSIATQVNCSNNIADKGTQVIQPHKIKIFTPQKTYNNNYNNYNNNINEINTSTPSSSIYEQIPSAESSFISTSSASPDTIITDNKFHSNISTLMDDEWNKINNPNISYSNKHKIYHKRCKHFRSSHIHNNANSKYKEKYLNNIPINTHHYTTTTTTYHQQTPQMLYDPYSHHHHHQHQHQHHQTNQILHNSWSAYYGHSHRDQQHQHHQNMLFMNNLHSVQPTTTTTTATTITAPPIHSHRSHRLNHGHHHQQQQQQQQQQQTANRNITTTTMSAYDSFQCAAYSNINNQNI